MTNISTTTDTVPDTVRRRQGRAALVLADLMTQDLPELAWSVARSSSSLPALRGSRDDGGTADRVDMVEAWARYLSVVPTWEALAGGSGEYCAKGWHMGVRITVGAWLLEAPGMAGA
jgi:hypothetical protein